MTSRERFHAVMNYEGFDRGLFAMPWFGFPGTTERWRGEGFRDEDLAQFPVDDIHSVGHLFFPSPAFEGKIVEDEGETVLRYNHEGILMREFKHDAMSSMPQFVRFPVRTRADFRAFARDHLTADLPATLGPEWKTSLLSLRDHESILWMIADRWGGFFGALRNMMGVEELCVAFHTDPALVEEMMDFIADRTIRIAGQILDVIDVDMFGLWEDMAYNVAPLIGPEMARRFMLPRYIRVVEFLRRRGVRWISLDSDGRIDELIPMWIDAGIDLLYPFEVAAGMDVVQVRRTYGRGLRMYGGVAKSALARGRAAIDEEVDRIRGLIDEGGFIANVDHSIPPDVSWDSFRYYMARMADVIGV